MLCFDSFIFTIIFFLHRPANLGPTKHMRSGKTEKDGDNGVVLLFCCLSFVTLEFSFFVSFLLWNIHYLFKTFLAVEVII